MISIWTPLLEFEDIYRVDPERCRQVILQCNSVIEIRDYLDHILIRLSQGERSAIGETWGVAIPLAYRLAIDDTASDYRIASNLKEAALYATYPELMIQVENEINWVCSSAYGAEYSTIKQIHRIILNELQFAAKYLDGNWKVYGRWKSVSSIYAKLYRLKSGTKRPKNDNSARSERVVKVIAQFEEQVLRRLHGDSSRMLPYDFEDLKWLLPDLLGFSLQLAEPPNSSPNLGSLKSRYRGVYRRLSEHFSGHVFYGPSFSKAWHMNRMVCHLEYQNSACSKVAMELFVRTDFDYFIGYGSYWRYKGVNLFEAASRDDYSYRRRFIRKIRECRCFRDVQDILFTEVTTGQLSLF